MRKGRSNLHSDLCQIHVLPVLKQKNLTARRSRASLRLRTRSGEWAGREGKGKEREPGRERPLPALSPRVTPARVTPRPEGRGDGLAVEQSPGTAWSTQGTEQVPNPCDTHIAHPWVPALQDGGGALLQQHLQCSVSVSGVLFHNSGSGAAEVGHGPPEPGRTPQLWVSPSVPSHSFLAGRACRVVCREGKGVLL